MLAALLVALCLVPGALAASRFHERNHSGLLFLYTFDDGQVPTSPPSEVRDASGRYLMGNLTTSTTGAVSWSTTRQGMTIPNVGGGTRVRSQLTSANVLSSLSDKFTIEIFLSNPRNPRSEALLVAGFVDWAPGSRFVRCEASDPIGNGGWMISSGIGGVLDFEFVMVVGGVPTCHYGEIALPTDTLRHLVIRAYDGIFDITSHGSYADRSVGSPIFSPQTWARLYTPLAIATPHASNGWPGTIYMIAMYDRALSDEEIAANRGFGPPNSFPYGGGALEVDEDVGVTLVGVV
jgi:hypothetical protein